MSKKRRVRQPLYVLGPVHRVSQPRNVFNPNPLYRVTDANQIVAYANKPPYKPSGFIIWDDQGTVLAVIVRPMMQRKGIGTALWNAAKVACPDLKHSPEMTSDGIAWVRSLGGGHVAAAGKATLIDPLHHSIATLIAV